MNEGCMYYIGNVNYDRAQAEQKRRKTKEKQSFLKAKKRRK